MAAQDHAAEYEDFFVPEAFNNVVPYVFRGWLPNFPTQDEFDLIMRRHACVESVRDHSQRKRPVQKDQTARTATAQEMSAPSKRIPGVKSKWSKGESQQQR